MKLRIDVTSADIAQGKRMECGDCPVVRALNRAAPPLRGDSWLADGALAFVPGRISLLLPHEAGMFIVRFDCGEPVFPFAFEIELPEDAAKYVTVPA